MALEASIREAMAQKLAEMKPQMDEAVAWIEAVTGEQMEGTFGKDATCMYLCSRDITPFRRMAAIRRSALQSHQ